MVRSSEKGMNLAWKTLLECPEWNESLTFPSSQSQRRTRRSSEPETRMSPWALKLTVLTQPLCFASFRYTSKRRTIFYKTIRMWFNYKLNPPIKIKTFSRIDEGTNLGGGEAIGEAARRDSTDFSSPEVDDRVVRSVEVCSTSLRLIRHLPLNLTVDVRLDQRREILVCSVCVLVSSEERRCYGPTRSEGGGVMTIIAIY